MNDMVDMSHFVEAKSDQLNADDLIGAPRTITIRRVTGNDGDQPVSIYFEGDNNKPFKPCKTMRRVLLAVWGRNGADYVGRSMTIYRDDSVTFGGLNVGGIRISHMSHIDKETVVVVMKTKGKKAGIKVYPLIDEPKEDAARKWADQYIGAVGIAADDSALDTLIAKHDARLAKLMDARPELHAECLAAVDARRSSFAPAEPNGFDDDMGDV